MIKPTSAHVSRYRHPDGSGDGRLNAPTFQRNSPPMIAQLAPWFAGKSGNVLEIGAGTGQHAAAFALAFPQLQWWPSDPDEIHRSSCAAWARHLRAPEREVLNIDAASNWAASSEIMALSPLIGVLSMNVIHISPQKVLSGIIRGSAQCLGPDGLLVFYGPFKEDGAHTGEGNAAFDQGLRAENPEWGVRDIVDIDAECADNGLIRAAFIQMPANNRLLIYKR